MSEKYVLEIKWDETASKDLPTLVGPFDDVTEAVEFIDLNIPNGVAELRTLSFPYLRSRP